MPEFDIRAADTHLASAIDASQTTCELAHARGAAGEGYPALPFWATLDPDDPQTREEILVTALTGQAATITRAAAGGSGVAHHAGSRVRLSTQQAAFLGRVGSAKRTDNIGPFTTEVDLTDLTVTWVAAPSIHYKLSFHAGRAASSVAGDRMAVYITDSSNNHVAEGDSVIFAAANVGEGPISCFCELTGLSGSVTYKMRAARTAGTGNPVIAAAAGNPATFLVEAIGP
jgi:hypothetical protein